LDKKLAHHGSIDALVYPFIYERSKLCDYEVLTDELCARLCDICDRIGNNRWRRLLEAVQEEVYHANGSIRGKLALSSAAVADRLETYRALRSELSPPLSGFILPRGAAPVGSLHEAKSTCKKIIRILVKLPDEGIDVPQHLADYFNILGNLFFTLAVLVADAQQQPRITFTSNSYNTRT